MILKKTFLLGCSIVAGVCLSGIASANTVTYQTNKPLTVTYQPAYQTAAGEIIKGERVTQQINGSLSIPVQLGNYQYVGIITDNVDGHELPEGAKQFGHSSCSARTDKTKTQGTITLIREPHKISCARS